ncbi:MAG: DNA primase [Solirubrobacterales bacterium]
MARFTPETIEKVRSAADMVEVVSAQTELKRSGARYQGLCPFHDERTPSFSVHPDEKLYHCFGCGVGGDIFDFVCETSGLEFPEAVETLAERYGVEVTRVEQDPEAEARSKARKRLQELLDRVASFYSSTLTSSKEASDSREYLASRGLGEEVLASFGVGYAPSAWDTLVKRGQQAGFTLQEMAEVGLVQKGREGGLYDRFRSRIMFPIRDARGRTIGFGARATTDGQKPKYLNSAETPFFHKSEVLYGIDVARPAMAKAGRAILVEGYTDVLALHQAGFSETVGIMGTAMTEQQVAALSSTVGTVILAFDADAAGQKAMLRAQEVAAGRKGSIRVVAMPEGEDPAEIATQPDGADRFNRLLEGAVALPEFHLDLVLGAVDSSSPLSRDEGLDRAVPVIASVPPGALRQELVRKASDGLGIETPVILARVEAEPPPSASRPAPVVAPTEESPPVEVQRSGVLTKHERRERSLLLMCVADPKEGAVWLERLEERHLSSDLSIRTVAWLKGNLEDPTEGIDSQDEDVRRLVRALVVRADPSKVGEGAIRRNFMELELAALEREIEQAGEEDAARRAELSRERSMLVEEVRRAEEEAA